MNPSVPGRGPSGTRPALAPARTVPFVPRWPALQSEIPHWEIFFPDSTATIVYDPSRGRVWAPGSFAADGRRWEAVELRQRGDSARTHPKHSWKVELPKGQRLHGQRKLNFIAGWLDAGYLTDMFAYRLMQASGAVAPLSFFVTLEVNGEHQGVYTQVEQVDSQFLEQHGLDEDGNVYRCGSKDCELKLTPPAHYQKPFEKKTNEEGPSADLETFLFEVSRTPEHELEAWLASRMDLESLLRTMAVNVLISMYGVDDSGSYLVHDLWRDRWYFVPWDLNNALFRYWRTEDLDEAPDVTRSIPVYTFYDDETIRTYEWKQGKYGGAHRPFNVLFQRVWDRPALRNQVLDRVEELMATVFSPAQADAEIDALHALLRPHLPKDPWVDQARARYAPQFLKKYVRGRIAFLQAELPKERLRGEGGVVINAVSAGGAVDDRGEPSGYVELYNREDVPVELGGKVITDFLRDEFRHRLPAGLSIPAKGKLRLWADGQRGQGATHLPFTLSPEGGELGLLGGQRAAALDIVYFPKLTGGASYRRVPDGAEAWGFEP